MIAVPSLFVTDINRVELREAHLPEPTEGELLLQAELTGISPGTEMRCLAGHQGGPPPFIPGYSFVGRVIGRGPGTKLAEGTRVYCSGTKKAEEPRVWGGHISKAVTPEEDVFVVPEGVDAVSAALVRLAAISFHGYKLGGAGTGHTVVVVGLGPIGLLSALIHQAAGARVLALDKLPHRLEFARNLGLVAESPDSPQAREILPRGASFVVDSTGVPAVLRSALEWVRDLDWKLPENPPGTLILQGSYGEQDVSVSYREAFSREMRLVVPRDTVRSDHAEMLRWCAEKKVHVAPLMTKILDPKDAQQAYDALINRQPGMITAGFDWAAYA